MNSCASVLGLIFLVLTDLGSIIGFATPYWITSRLGNIPLIRLTKNFGLWAKCSEDECSWVFQSDGTKVNSEVLGLIGLVLTDLAGIVAFATPFWLDNRSTKISFGLWASCKDASNCDWIFTGGQVNDKNWFIAVQGLMAVGLCVALVALLIATIALCCQCQNCNYAGTVAGLLLTAFLAMGIAVTLFGIKAAEEDVYNAKIDDSGLQKFGWSFWLSAGSAGMALITSFVYGCSSRS
ncbi:hypothetical protein FSP39_023937 [Pinctada imbricata]|uniref:Claudin n=1 Tax=Pinctada imbricata TaxID=66713 RepID=A0AA88XNQ7_PINIB|nr:hypothetical protein FSP39_023937 [Pinctada imbricata]